ncbi:mps one binder kinase activator-like 4 [Pisolithus orientalis]|uniref:mps one binder kinase activator-like 4 n=1 Tax=Pisolithus orientalis TaxID=936130 RepID=UPI0022246388|nr:mps one binder kinase activator-like 4 [Pisolithus orientalis]KAI6006328.1 mps one binder kinase activator-like 4 [Pisolithus orientalis]
MQLHTSSTMAAVAVQRPYRGSRVSSFYPVKSVPPLSSLDSAFQLQEYISLLIRLDVHDVDTIVSLPGKTTLKGKGKDKDTDESGQDAPESDGKMVEDGERKGEPSVDRACWIYEQLRRLAQDLSHPLITTLQQECTRSSCPQMQAGEWLYLCVAHGNDEALEQCCAIDYIVHTVDSATALLNSPRAFPSRLSIPQSSHRHFSSLARRLSRIFSHAYFHHREAFQQAEADSPSLFDLVPPEFLVIPESAIQADCRSREDVEPPRLLAAAVHPDRTSPSDNPVAEQTHSIPAMDSGAPVYSQTEDTGSMGSRQPTSNTMILNEVHNITEELVKSVPGSEVGSSTLDTQVVDSEPSLRQMWIGEQTELQEMGDPHVAEEPVPTAPGSPPVDEVPLISLVELPDSTEAPSATSLQSDPILPMPKIKEEPPSTTASIVAMATPEEITMTDPASTTDANEPPFSEIKLPEESQSASDPNLVQVEELHPAHVEPETKEFSLDLSEPPPSEPVPPESDVTDEAIVHDDDDEKE